METGHDQQRDQGPGRRWLYTAAPGLEPLVAIVEIAQLLFPLVATVECATRAVRVQYSTVVRHVAKMDKGGRRYGLPVERRQSPADVGPCPSTTFSWGLNSVILNQNEHVWSNYKAISQEPWICVPCQAEPL